ncbi:MAG: hypothetical protein L6R43_00500 [Planctomycetes bacterium]|nr:hypothetical protein [Planctomycetota bacterium]
MLRRQDSVLVVCIAAFLFCYSPANADTVHKIKEVSAPGGYVDTGPGNQGEYSFSPTDTIQKSEGNVAVEGRHKSGSINMKKSGWAGIKSTGKVTADGSEGPNSIDIGPADLRVKGKRNVKVTHSTGNCGGTVTIGAIQAVRFIGNLASSGTGSASRFYQYSEPRVVMINGKIWKVEWKVKKDGTTTQSSGTEAEFGAGAKVGTEGSGIEVTANVTFHRGTTSTSAESPDDDVDIDVWAMKGYRGSCSGTLSIETTSDHMLRLTHTVTTDDALTMKHTSNLMNYVKIYTIVDAPPGTHVPEDPPPPDSGGGTPTPPDGGSPFVPGGLQDSSGDKYRADGSNMAAAFVPESRYSGFLNPSSLQVGRTAELVASAGTPAEAPQTVLVTVTPGGVVSVPASVVIAADDLFQGVEVTAVGVGEATITMTFPDGLIEDHPITVIPVASSPSFSVLGEAARSVATGQTHRIAIQRSYFSGFSAQASELEVELESQPTGILGSVPEVLTIPADESTGSITFAGVAAGSATLTFKSGSVVVGTVAVTVQGPPSLLDRPNVAMKIGDTVLLSVPLSLPLQSEGSYTVTVTSGNSVVVVLASGIVYPGEPTIPVIVEGTSLGASTVSVSLSGGNTKSFVVDVMTEFP